MKNNPCLNKLSHILIMHSWVDTRHTHTQKTCNCERIGVFPRLHLKNTFLRFVVSGSLTPPSLHVPSLGLLASDALCPPSTPCLHLGCNGWELSWRFSSLHRGCTATATPSTFVPFSLARPSFSLLHCGCTATAPSPTSGGCCHEQ